MLGNHRNIITLAPRLQLFYRRSSKGITRCQHHRLTFRQIPMSKLANRCGLPRTINPNDQNHKRSVGGHLERLIVIRKRGNQKRRQCCHDGIDIDR